MEHMYYDLDNQHNDENYILERDYFKNKSYIAAERYYLLSIENEYNHAMNDLGLIYKWHYNDDNKAEQYYLMAVRHNNINALYNLGILYKTQKKYHKAIEYANKANDNNHIHSKKLLGDLYVKREYDDYVENHIMRKIL